MHRVFAHAHVKNYSPMPTFSRKSDADPPLLALTVNPVKLGGSFPGDPAKAWNA